MSKNNNSAKTAIKSYLDSRAVNDELFAKSYAKENKSIDECFNYILSEAKKQGSAVAMTDEEVYGLAVHYYDEDNIKMNKVSHARVSTSVSASKLVLTEEEKEAARLEALKAYQAAEQKKLEEERKKKLEKKREKAAQQQEVQPSLFDLNYEKDNV